LRGGGREASSMGREGELIFLFGWWDEGGLVVVDEGMSDGLEGACRLGGQGCWDQLERTEREQGEETDRRVCPS
jgi:hypothetical protein